MAVVAIQLSATHHSAILDCSTEYLYEFAMTHRVEEAFRHLRLLIKCLKFKPGKEVQEAYEVMAKACQKTFSSQITKLSREHKQSRMTFSMRNWVKPAMHRPKQHW